MKREEDKDLVGRREIDQVEVKQVIKSCTGNRNLKMLLDIVREKCTGRLYIRALKDVNKCTNTCRIVLSKVECLSEWGHVLLLNHLKRLFTV